MTQRAWYYIEVFPDPNDEHTVYVLSAPALKSIDGGKTWSRISGTHGDYHDLWINPDNSKNLCISNDGGAAISFNQGDTWSTQYNMPTAQFYRLSVDNHFPYRIYAGQQDNSSVRILSFAHGEGGIYEEHWTASAGGESAFLAFDPDDPQYVMGGSYLGSIELLNTRANASTSIMAAPIQYLGRAASDMKYRFNWNAPIIWSRHEPGTFYHAAQLLLRTRDMGKSWEEVSPDLTNNDKEKQIKGGGPYTVEAVGAENYGTISYVAESPHEAGVIWATTDDGNVQLTRDGCESWTNVTPGGLAECLVNMIDLSPHNAATAYIATTRYKFNDHTPALYKTTDYGQSWTNITSGIPDGAYTRVVREDDRIPGLLYAGTEKGVYISWDAGANWEPLQLNLPRTPILDLMVHRGDLIAATSGRSFWILDDLGLLGQYEKKESAEARLYQPEDTYLVSGYSPLNGNSESFKGASPLNGVNPATGVVIYYELPKLPDSVDVTIEIRNEAGQLVRSLSTKKSKRRGGWAGGPPSARKIAKKEGLNRLVWDVRHETMPGIPGVYIEAGYRGHRASPGKYSITMKVGEEEQSTEVNLKPNPLYGIGPDVYREYDQFMTEMEQELTEMHQMVNKLHTARGQLDKLAAQLKDIPEHKAIHKEATELSKKMKAWDEEMVQRKSKAYDDVENFENKFTANYLFLINRTESSIPRVNQPNRDRRTELDAQWAELEIRGQKMINQDIPNFNKALWEAGLGAIWDGMKSSD